MGFKVQSGPKPVDPRIERRREVRATIERLQPGQWFEWSDADSNDVEFLRKLSIRSGVKFTLSRGSRIRGQFRTLIIGHPEEAPQGVVGADAMEVIKARADERAAESSPRAEVVRATSGTPAVTAAPAVVVKARPRAKVIPQLPAGFVLTDRLQRILLNLKHGRKVKRSVMATEMGLRMFPYDDCSELALYGLLELTQSDGNNYVQITQSGSDLLGELTKNAGGRA